MQEPEHPQRSLRRRFSRRPSPSQQSQAVSPRSSQARGTGSGIVPVAPSSEQRSHFNLRDVLANPSARSGTKAAPRPRPTPSKGNAPSQRSGVRSRAEANAGMTARTAGKTVQPSRSAPLRSVAAPTSALVPERRPSNLIGFRRATEPSLVRSEVDARPRLPTRPSNPPSPRHQRRPARPPSPLLYVVRLLILGVGLGAIAGTVMSIWNPALRELPDSATQETVSGGLAVMEGKSQAVAPTAAGSLSPLLSALPLHQEMKTLARSIQTLAADYPGLTPGVYLVDLDRNDYLSLNGTTTFPAASTIKVPVLVAFFQDVDAGKIRLDEMLTMEQKHVGGGSGEMQYQPVGTQYTALETAINMIVISDNTATNMLIDRMGGAAALNQRFRSWSLVDSEIRNPLPDLGGTNTTSPKDLSDLLIRVSQGELLSLRSRDRMLEIMRQTVTDTLLPRGLDEGAIISHKTGTIDTVVGDTGLIDMPSGKRYAITVLVLRPTDDQRAQELIRQISRTTYQYLKTSQSNSSIQSGASPLTSLNPPSSAASSGGPSSAGLSDRAASSNPPPILFPPMDSPH